MDPHTQIKTATKDLVESLLAMNTSNRAIKKSVVECYKTDIADGRWFVTNQGIGVDCNGVLVDGQHRLIAIRELGYPPVKLLIITGLDPRVREVVDQHAKRNTRDVWRMFMDLDVANIAPAVCTVIDSDRRGWAGGKVSPQKLKDILDEHFEEMQFVIDTVKDFQLRWSSPYLAAVVLACKTHSTRWNDIAAFVNRVESGENLTRRMPEFHLRNLILTGSRTSGGYVRHERFSKAKRAILASLSGEELGILRAAA